MANFNVIVDETNNQVIVNEDAQSIVIRSLGTVGPKGDNGNDGADGVGVPVGGTTGQVLAKNSNADYDTEWVDQTGGGGGGVTDHGALTGLSDDDHTQYHNDTRGDARYYTKTLSDAAYEPKNSNIQAHIIDTANPHNVTASQVGLSEVDNTADVDKPISSATQTALDDKADDSAVVHKTGDETVAGLKQFDNSFTDDQPHEGTDFYLTHTATAPVSNGSTVGIRNTVTVDGDFDRTNWLDSARQERLEIDGTGDHEFSIGALTQVTQLGSGVVDLAAGQLAGVYCDNPAATINRAAGLIGSVEAVQGTITEANGVIGEVARQPGATIDKAIAFKVSDTVQGTDTYGFYNQTAGAKNKFNETDFTGAVIPSVVALTDAATIAVNAALGNQFTVTLGGNRTLGNPTGAVNGQLLLFALRQDGAGSRTITLDTKFRLGADITSITLSTGANKTDYLGVRYHSSDDTFDVISFVGGY